MSDNQGKEKWLFKLGQIVATPAALDLLDKETNGNGRELSLRLLAMHVTGRWGQLDDHDKAENDAAVKNGDRILSSYDLPHTGEKVWLITEWDRSVTTILLPSDY